MKLLRLICACTLLLLTAVPLFALPCETCVPEGGVNCEETPGSGTRCMWHIDYCETVSAPNCSPLASGQAQPVLADFVVASIEVKRPAQGTAVVAAPAVVAELQK